MEVCVCVCAKNKFRNLAVARAHTKPTRARLRALVTHTEYERGSQLLTDPFVTATNTTEKGVGYRVRLNVN